MPTMRAWHGKENEMERKFWYEIWKVPLITIFNNRMKYFNNRMEDNLPY